MSLTITTRPAKATHIVSLQGRLDSNTYAELEKVLEPILANRPETLIVDFKELSFISSAGLRVLISAGKTLAERNGKLCMTNMQPQIIKVLEIIQSLPAVSIFRNDAEMDEYLAMMQKRVIDQK